MATPQGELKRIGGTQTHTHGVYVQSVRRSPNFCKMCLDVTGLVSYWSLEFDVANVSADRTRP